MCHEGIESTLVSILGKYGVRKIGLFGLYACGEERHDSDLDVLVDFVESKSLLTLVRIERELSENLGIKVDLLTEQAIETRVKKGYRMLHSEKVLEEKLGRNDPCPCDQGGCFKKCCLDKGCF